MKPSVGQIVHFYTMEPAKHFNGQGAGPYVAIITQVFEGSPYSNLKVLPPFAAPYDEGSVIYEPSCVIDHGCCWCWPPREDGKAIA
ncbi:MAG: hypothetical protein E5V89_14120 [Mesorhizobium sp.]|nr:MAG: hypothetical protein E5V89_14120 [Mesorhizobium sp.]